MQDAAIKLRALPHQRELIDKAAQLLGRSRSQFILEAACDRAQAVVLNQVFFRLDEDTLRQFNSMLDAPARPDTGFKRLMSLRSPWSRVRA